LVSLKYKFGIYSKEVRVIKFELSDGIIEVLLTNIFSIDNIITSKFVWEFYCYFLIITILHEHWLLYLNQIRLASVFNSTAY